jgi:hypothetical protein
MTARGRDFDVPVDGVVVGRIFKAAESPVGTAWKWTMLFDYRWPTHCYEATRDAAMAAFTSLGDGNKTLGVYLSGKLSGSMFQTVLSVGRSGRI